LILTFDLDVKDLDVKVPTFLYLISNFRLLYCAIFSKIDQAVQDLSQKEIFELINFDLEVKVTISFLFLALYGAIFSKIDQSVQDLSKYFLTFDFDFEMKYFTFDFDLKVTQF